MKGTWLLLLIVVAGGAAQRAAAHATSTSYLSLEAREPGGDVRGRWDIALADIAFSVELDSNGDRRISWGEITARQGALAAFVFPGLEVARNGQPCPARLEDLALATHLDEPYLSIVMQLRCARAGRLQVATPLLFGLDASQRTLIEVTTGAGIEAAVLAPGGAPWTESGRAGFGERFVQFVGHGAWHVWIGYDHLAFLLLLLLPSVLRPRGAVLRDVLGLVTTFTLAHSVTLALAASGLVRLPERPIEFLIALSIVVAGLLNLWPRAVRWRLSLAFGFGLVHGFGFANALAGLDVQGVRLAPLLAGFNVGVELAQLALVALALPLLLAWHRSPIFAARIAPLLSIVVATGGGLWMIERWP
ncbi:MAG: HupE/UreJ family protein [Steroidobacteraceae bacterium]